MEELRERERERSSVTIKKKKRAKLSKKGATWQDLMLSRMRFLFLYVY